MKIPRMTDDRVQENMLPNARFDANAGDFGRRNIQQAEQATSGLIGEAMQLQQKAQREADEAVQLEAGTRASEFELGWNRKIRETQGKNTLSLADQFESEWRKFKGDTRNSLVKNAKQGMMVDRVMSSNYSQLRNMIDVHTSSQMDKFYDDQSAALIETDRNAALDSMDPMRVAESIGKQKAVVSQVAVKKGWSEEQTNLKLLEVEQDTKTKYIQRVADNDPVSAQAMIDDPEEQKMLGSDNVTTLSNYIAKKDRELKYIAKNAMIDNDMKFMSDLSSGNMMDINSIAKAQTSGTISTEVAKAAIAYISDPDLITVEDTPIFSKYAEAVFDLKDKAAIQKLFADALTGGADGKPNMNEIQSLVKITAIRSKGLTLSEFEDQKRAAANPPKKSFMQNAFEAVKSWADKNGSMNDREKSMLKSGLYKELAKEILTKEPLTAEEAQRVSAKVIEKGQAQVNPNRTKYQVDQIYDFPAGRGICVGYKEDGTPIFKKVK